MSVQLCPCQSNKNYEICCQPLHLFKKHAKTAKALMRSRYSAFVKGQVDYLIETQYPAKRTPNGRADIQNNIKNTTWLGLKILSAKKGKPKDLTGLVEFIATYTEPNQPGIVHQLHERSEFVKENNRWYYVSGTIY